MKLLSALLLSLLIVPMSLAGDDELLPTEKLSEADQKLVDEAVAAFADHIVKLQPELIAKLDDELQAMDRRDPGRRTLQQRIRKLKSGRDFLIPGAEYFGHPYREQDYTLRSDVVVIGNPRTVAGIVRANAINNPGQGTVRTTEWHRVKAGDLLMLAPTPDGDGELIDRGTTGFSFHPISWIGQEEDLRGVYDRQHVIRVVNVRVKNPNARDARLAMAGYHVATRDDQQTVIVRVASDAVAAAVTERLRKS